MHVPELEQKIYSEVLDANFQTLIIKKMMKKREKKEAHKVENLEELNQMYKKLQNPMKKKDFENKSFFKVKMKNNYLLKLHFKILTF